MRALTLAFVAAFGLAVSSATALGGEYHVQQCHGSSGLHVSQGWNLATSGTSGGTITGCSGGYFRMQDTVGGGTDWLLLHTPVLPGSLRFSAAQFNYFAQGPSGQAAASVRFCAGANVVAAMCVAGFWDNVAYADGSMPGGKTVGCALIGSNLCKELQFILNLNGGLGHFWFGNLDFAVSDPVNPTPTSPSGGTLHSSQNTVGRAWNRGSRTFNIGGADADSGVKSIGAYVDVFTNGASVISPTACTSGPYVEFQPCTGSHGSAASINTATFADGQHTLHSTVTDASDNSASSASTFYVDNARPATPTSVEPDVSGSNGWNTTNSFKIDWINTGETTENEVQSGISQVVVDINPTEGAQSDPSPITVPVGGTVAGVSATRSSISGLTVPAVGEWSLRLMLIDGAGNESEVGDGSGSSADSDTTIGYDPAAPAGVNGQQNGWISRDELAAGFDQEFTYAAFPSTVAPLCGFAGSIDKNPTGTVGGSVNLPGGGSARKWRLPGTLDEDTHYVHLRSVSCNGTASVETETVPALVDRTDPIGTITGLENGKWYKDGQGANLTGADALSGMTPAPLGEPDSQMGAYLNYTINGVGPAPEVAPRGSSATIPVTGEGQKELRFSPVDFAGNKAAPKGVTFGIDATNPDGYINRQDPARPTLLSANVTDAPSGVSYAIFSVRTTSSGGDWIQLPTSVAGLDLAAVGSAVSSGIVSARFPDTGLAQGTYDLKVNAYDQAGNPLETQRFRDGSIARVENPMRDKTGTEVKLFKALRECKKNKAGKMKCSIKKCTKWSNGACYKVLKGRVVLQGGSTTVTSEYNRGSIATGVLTDANGNALKNTDVTVTTTEKVKGTKREVGTATTDNTGIFAIRVPAGANKSVKVHYEGSELRQPSYAVGTMNTRAKLKLRVSRKYAKTGQTITFSGKVTSSDGSYPAGGKIAALQFFAARKWRPAVGVVHTDQRGKFKVKYKFDGARVKAKIIFRVSAPSEDAWGHVSSVSKPTTVLLNY